VLALAALFLVPLAAAFWLYYGGGGWRPRGATNQGELVTPPRTLPSLDFAGADGQRIPGDLLRDRWTLLYVGDGRCDARCEEVLHLTRQTRIALNKDSDRVRRVFLATGPCCEIGVPALEHPDLVVAIPTDAQLAALAPLLPAPERLPPDRAGRIYLVDPLGNLMMSYPATAPDKALLTDLRRLLRLSHIG
jgi:cytochrome oxidase Cu insertion factor (SCO1/SenC/PrrC family)